MKGLFEKKRAFNVIAFNADPFQEFPPMFHPHCELIYVTHGSIRTVIDGKEHTLNTGEAVLLFPLLTHSYHPSEDAQASVILFHTEITSFESILKNTRPMSPYFKLPDLIPIIRRAIELFRENDANSERTAMGYLNAIIGEIIPYLKLYEMESPEKDVSTSVLQYCSEHFKEDINISTVASALYISPSYVSKLFTVKLKYKFREYINMLRINEATRMLAETDMRIVEIMLECGFKNQSSFNRIFFDIKGVTPYQYRTNNTNNTKR